MKPRLGHINFLNCAPLIYGMRNHDSIVQLVHGNPAELNEQMANNQLDISPISSIEYCRFGQRLLVLPQLCIASNGPVLSIQLISKMPIESLTNQKILLTNKSATSHVMLQVIMAKMFQVFPAYGVDAPDLEKMLDLSCACLLIGDDALAVAYQPPKNLYLYDLGELWYRFTNLPMVYAIWVVRKQYYNTNPILSHKVGQLLGQGIRKGLEELDSVSDEMALITRYSPEFLRLYFSGLEYGLTARHKRGLLHFFSLAKDLDLIAEMPCLEMF